MKVYLDTCSLNRPLDDKAQMRVALEAEAVLGILTRIEEGSVSLVSSEVLALEVQRTSQPERRVFVEAMIEGATEFISLAGNESVRNRSYQLISSEKRPLTP